MEKLKLTGKKLTEDDSSFVEFEIDGYLKEIEEIFMDLDNKSCYESIWMGEKNRQSSFDSGSILLCFDYMESIDYETLREHLTPEAYRIVKNESEKF